MPSRDIQVRRATNKRFRERHLEQERKRTRERMAAARRKREVFPEASDEELDRRALRINLENRSCSY